jgi:hypothetical protein
MEAHPTPARMPLESPDSAQELILAANKKASARFAEYKAKEEDGRYLGRDVSIKCMCSDGRVDPAMDFKDSDEAFRREQRPMAGNRWFMDPEFLAADTPEKLDAYFSANEAKVKAVFAMLFDDLLSKDPQPSIDLEAHAAEKENHHHGCGAHGSNAAAALAETAKNAYLLRKVYPGIRIIRTIRYTDSGTVVPARSADSTALTAEGTKTGIPQGLRKMVAEFDLPVRDLEEPGHGVYRTHKGNPHNVDMANHNERILRVSMNHQAFHAIAEGEEGAEQALRLSYVPDAAFLTQWLQTLEGIIEKNYLKNNAGEPIILHLDVPKGNGELADLRKHLLSSVKINPVLGRMIKESKLFVVLTETDPETYVAQVQKEEEL